MTPVAAMGKGINPLAELGQSISEPAQNSNPGALTTDRMQLNLTVSDNMEFQTMRSRHPLWLQ